MANSRFWYVSQPEVWKKTSELSRLIKKMGSDRFHATGLARAPREIWDKRYWAYPLGVNQALGIWSTSVADLTEDVQQLNTIPGVAQPRRLPVIVGTPECPELVIQSYIDSDKDVTVLIRAKVDSLPKTEKMQQRGEGRELISSIDILTAIRPA